MRASTSFPCVKIVLFETIYIKHPYTFRFIYRVILEGIFKRSRNVINIKI